MSHCITRDFLDAVKEDLLYAFHGTVSSRMGVRASTRSESRTYLLILLPVICFMNSVIWFRQHLRRQMLIKVNSSSQKLCQKALLPSALRKWLNAYYNYLEKSNHLVVYDPWHLHGIFEWIGELWTQLLKMTLWNTRYMDQMDRWGSQVCGLFPQPFYSALHLCTRTSKGGTQLTCISYELWHVDQPLFHNPSG